jgi:hypothetical protein
MTTIPMTYWWQKAYDAAVLEMDLAKLPGRAMEALQAIEERLRSFIVYGGVEHVAIVEARKSLYEMKSKRR